MDAARRLTYRFPLETPLFNVQRGNPPLQGTVADNIDAAAQSPVFDNCPIIPHEHVADVDCCGCLMVGVREGQANILCNECGAVVRTVAIEDVEAVMLELSQTDTICGARCTHCGALILATSGGRSRNRGGAFPQPADRPLKRRPFLMCIHSNSASVAK